MSCTTRTVLLGALATLVPFVASPATAARACGEVRKACEAAGFVQGGGRNGNGLARDCMDPLLNGTNQPRKATLSLPNVDPAKIAACKAEKTGTTDVNATAEPEQPASPPSGAARGANIVFILADDFSLDLISSRDGILARSMPNLKKMQEEGTTFTNYFVTDSLCCPSRSSIFTGKLPHDTGVFRNSGPDGGFGAFVLHNNDPVTFAVALHEVGYRTAMLGKYLNGYKPEKNGVPPGWSEWDVDGELGYQEYNYFLNENGAVRRHPEYLTDEISTLGQGFIERAASGAFLIELASFAPHAPYVPPARYANDFPELLYDQNAAFGARPDASAPDWLKAIKPLAQKDIDAIEQAFRNRVRSDHGIDDMIAAVRAELIRLGIDKNTYVFFSSDNGYHMGEWSLRPGKMTPFDTDIRVPLIVVGPGVPAARVVSDVVENIDLCPTFTAIAGTSAPTQPDGHSLLGLLHPLPNAMPIAWRHEALIEHHNPGYDKTDPDLQEIPSGNPPPYEAIRTTDALYVEYDDAKHEIGFYDLRDDPYELHNVAAGTPEAILKRWHDVLSANANCHGADACWAAQRMVP